MFVSDLQEAARELAGNHEEFQCFAWSRKYDLDDPSEWAIVYTHNRDSGLLARCNAEIIEEEMGEFAEGDDPDVVFESHSHWVCGHVDGFSIRIYKDGEITEAFRAYHEVMERLADYPILDESRYSDMEYEATLENFGLEAWRLKREYELPDGWPSQVFSWFWDNDQRAVENTDDQGGYASEEELREAFEALGYRKIEETC